MEEPLADALGISLLELMRSEVQDADNAQKAETMSREEWNSQKEKDTLYTSAEVTETSEESETEVS